MLGQSLPHFGYLHLSEQRDQVFDTQRNFFLELGANRRLEKLIFELVGDVDYHLSNTLRVNYEVWVVHTAILLFPDQATNNTGPVACDWVLVFCVLLNDVRLDPPLALDCDSFGYGYVVSFLAASITGCPLYPGAHPC